MVDTQNLDKKTNINELDETKSKLENNNQNDIEKNPQINDVIDIKDKEIDTKKEKIEEKISNEKNSSKTFLQKVKDFSKKNMDYLIVSATVFVLFIFVCIANNAIPFGNKTIIVSDSYSQIAEMFEHIFNLFEGKAEFFYTNYLGSGVEIFSTIQYMLTNPFYIIVLFGGRSNIFLMISFAMMLMLIFNGITFIWFSRKNFKNVSLKTRVILSLFYVFSGYVNYCFGFITWFIYPSLILFVIDRFINFFKTQKIASLIAVLVWYVCSCYSIGISTIIVLFILMTASILYLKENEEKAKYLTSLCIVFVVTALASIAILFPSIMALLDAPRTSSFLKSLLATKNMNFFTKISVLFVEPFITILFGIYIVKCNKKDKLNKFLLFIGIILFLPVFLDSIMKILCFSQYQGFFNRFYFLNEAFIFSLALMLFEKELLKFNENKTEMIPKVLVSFMFVLVGFTLVFLGFFFYKQIGLSIKAPMYDKSVLCKILFSMFGCILFVFLVSIFFYWRKNLSGKFIKNVLSVIMIFSFSMSLLIFTSNPCEVYTNREELKTLVKNNKVDDKVKIFSLNMAYDCDNLNLNSGRHLSYFSSLISKKTISAFEGLGFSTGNVYETVNRGFLLSDILIGNKYYVNDEPLNRPYLVEIDRSDKFYLYENILATDGTFVLNSDFSFDDKLSVIENFEKLQNYYGIDGELIRDVEITTNKIIDEKTGEEKLEIKIIAPTDGIFYLNKRVNITEDLYKVSGHDILSDISYLEAGEEFSLVFSYFDEGIEEDLKGYFLDYKITEEIGKKLNEKTSKFEFTKDGYFVDFDAKTEQSLYVMVPNIDGLNYSLNGNNIEAQEVLGGMVKISLTNEMVNSKLIVKYNYPHFLKWILIIIIAIVIITLILLLDKYTKFRAIQKIIDVAMKIVAGSLVFIIYILGSLLSLIGFFL